jgi:hypothetical protein
MVDNFEKKRKNTNKTQLLPSFLMVDQRKKASESGDLPGTLNSCPRRNYVAPTLTLMPLVKLKSSATF